MTITVNCTQNSIYIKSVEITTTSESGTTLEDNDLALTGAPVALTFDLYDNAEPQVINYTTSSTGAVTIPESNFFETAIDETNKTITVTPVAVTNGVKEAAVNQAADDTYKAGSASFTVDITDSTPFAGGDVTFDATIDMGTSPLVKNGVTFECGNGVLNNGSEYRLYKNSVTTFSVDATSGNKITQIVFVGTNSNPASGFASQDGWTTNGNNGTWTGESTSVSFTASGAQVRATQIIVTITTPGDDPYIISADNVNIAYDAEEGAIAYTINNPVEGGSIDASCEEDWLVVDDEPQYDNEGTFYFLCNPNPTNTARTATVTLTYTYGEETVTKEVTVTQAGNPNVVNRIEEITEVDAYYAVKGTVVAKNSRGFVIGDGTGYVYTYLGTAPSYSVGDMVKISGTTGTYGNVIQFTNAATITEATESEYTPLTPAAMTEVPDFTDGYHLSEYYQFEGTLTKSGSNYIVAVGEGQLRFSYPTQTEELEALDGKTVTAKAYFSGISGSGDNAIATFMLESIEEVVTTVTITIKQDFTATTFSCDKALDFSGKNIQAFIITDENGTTEPVTVSPANEGLYIEGEPGSYEIPIYTGPEVDPLAGNLLVATEQTTGQVLTFTPDASKVYYVFGKQNGKEAFFKVPAAGYTLPDGNKAVLEVDASAGAKEMIVIGGEATGINSIDNGQLTIDNYYTVDGKLVKGQPTQKGLYIVNGRKVVVK